MLNFRLKLQVGAEEGGTRADCDVIGAIRQRAGGRDILAACGQAEIGFGKKKLREGYAIVTNA